MSTRGIYGFRKGNSKKYFYNHSDSYPSGLGLEIIDLIKKYSDDEMLEIYNKTELVDGNSHPSKEQINYCLSRGWTSLVVSEKSVDDWYCLLRNIQSPGDYVEAALENEKVYRIDDSDFLNDGIFCDYGYVIDLSRKKLIVYSASKKVGTLDFDFIRENDDETNLDKIESFCY